MLNEQELEQRRARILKGVSGGEKITEIASHLGVRAIVVKKELKSMRYERGTDLRQAQEVAYNNSQIVNSQAARLSSDRFMSMTGMTFQEKTFQNMVEFYRPELQRIMKSLDQPTAIMRLPKSVLKTLRNNGIIIHERRTCEIAPRARSLLS